MFDWWESTLQQPITALLKTLDYVVVPYINNAAQQLPRILRFCEFSLAFYFVAIMDIRKWFKNPPMVTSAKSHQPTPPDVVNGEGQQSVPKPVGGSLAEPNPGSSHRAEATSSRWSATATGAVLGPQLPVVSVSDFDTDNPKQVVLKKYSVKMFGSKKW